METEVSIRKCVWVEGGGGNRYEDQLSVNLIL